MEIDFVVPRFFKDISQRNSSKLLIITSMFQKMWSIRNTLKSANHLKRLYSYQSHYYEQKKIGMQSTLYYGGSVIVLFIGASYLAVPLYQLICTQTGLDGTPLTAPGHKFEPSSMIPVENASRIKIKFSSAVSEQMKWKFERK
jgi:hypothetical protein